MLPRHQVHKERITKMGFSIFSIIHSLAIFYTNGIITQHKLKKKVHNNNMNRKGFTLIELLVVTAINRDFGSDASDNPCSPM